MLQTNDAESDALLSNLPAHHSDGSELLSDVDFHDVQCMAVCSSCFRSGSRLFPVRLEEIRYRGRHRTLSLTKLNKNRGFKLSS